MSRFPTKIFVKRAQVLARELITLSYGSTVSVTKVGKLSCSSRLALIASKDCELQQLESRRRGYGKESYRFGKAADCGGQGYAGAAGRSGAGTGTDQHHGVLQAVQCAHQREGTRRTHHSRRGVGLQRPVFHI